MFYHLIISIEGAYEDIVRLDLRESQLEEMVLKPYHDGTPMQIQGKTILLDDITGFKITRTSESSANIAQKNNLSSIDPDFSPLSTERSRIAESGEDVTAEFITVPPGSNKFDKKEAKGNLKTDARKVFVVHGRDVNLSKSIFSFLESIGLDPIEWSEAIKGTGKATPYIGEVLEYAFSAARAIVVMMTPDDLAYLKPELRKEDDEEYEKVLTPQARPNVLFEAGMSMEKSPDRTVIIEVGKLRPFSDLSGRHVIRMSGSIDDRKEIAYRLKNAGCAVNTSGNEWKTVGDFHIQDLVEKIKIAAPNDQYVPNKLDEKIMIVIGHHYEGGRTIDELSENFKFGKQRLRLILDNLVKSEFISWDRSDMERWGAYHLEPRGREYLNNKKLL